MVRAGLVKLASSHHVLMGGTFVDLMLELLFGCEFFHNFNCLGRIIWIM